jgi:hypothetical protein
LPCSGLGLQWQTCIIDRFLYGVILNERIFYVYGCKITAAWYGDAIAAVKMNNQEGEDHMLWTIAVILIVLWLLGLITSYTMGGFIHIVLVIAIIVVIVGFIQGRRG